MFKVVGAINPHVASLFALLVAHLSFKCFRIAFILTLFKKRTGMGSCEYHYADYDRLGVTSR